MKRLIFIISIVFSCVLASAQKNDKAFIPSDDSDDYDTELEEEVRMETEIKQSLPSVKEQQRMMRHRDDRKQKEYDNHHKEIQDQKTLKYMKSSKKKSEAYNKHKPPLKSRLAAKKKARRR